VIERILTVLGIAALVAAAALYAIPRLSPSDTPAPAPVGIDLARIISERGIREPGRIPADQREVMRALASATEENATEIVAKLRSFLAERDGSALRRAGVGWALFLARKPEEARKELDRALEIDPDCPLALAAYGYEHFRYRRFGKAEECFRRATRICPTIAEWRGLYARVLLAAGRAEEALAEAETFVALAPRSPGGYLTVGDVHLRAGRIAEASRWYDAGCRLAGPDSKTAGEHEAVLAAMRGW